MQIKENIKYSPVIGEFPAQRASKLRVACFCEGNSPVIGEFPAQRASNVIRWRHHVVEKCADFSDPLRWEHIIVKSYHFTSQPILLFLFILLFFLFVCLFFFSNLSQSTKEGLVETLYY